MLARFEQNRAIQAEASVYNIICFLIALIRRAVVLVNYDLLDQLMHEFTQIKSSILWSMARRTNP